MTITPPKPRLFVIRCHNCGKDYGWSGGLMDRPACTHCGELPDCDWERWTKAQESEST